MPRVSKSEAAESLAYLRRTLQPGATVYTILRSVSRSGMQREVDFYTIRDNRPVWLAGATVESDGGCLLHQERL